ncbi:tRNA (guanine-N1)-methyltransferase [candidate division TA06 bacterium DG_26]|uniref:tRNA (guanine-N(1)-)-methyltransferase n=1 Tax=candidate division TA06 bacterium DG_26 TaxID=1703771 RepID=A0A0S7WIY6_UNCT6|nr:MAG: tRNA (guanine-N1)-methyltransferase [candidate division TA06 bacterium DG_26]
MLEIDIVTIFPKIFDSPFSEGIIRIAQEKGLLKIRAVDLREFAKDSHGTVDDKPYGGGPGMVMKPKPLFDAIRELKNGAAKTFLLSPQGMPFDQSLANRLAHEQHLILICGRYKGVDERTSKVVDGEISIGDYILSGGEFAALVIIDAVTRLIPGVIGDFDSAAGDSFYNRILDAPYYTRPGDLEGLKVPEVLLSGDHEEIRKWRKKEALKRTLLRRPDLLEKADLDEEAMSILRELRWKKKRERRERCRRSSQETR